MTLSMISVAKACPNLASVDFSGTNMKDSDLEKIVSVC